MLTSKCDLNQSNIQLIHCWVIGLHLFSIKKIVEITLNSGKKINQAILSFAIVNAHKTLNSVFLQ